jgi:hypothetical protein
MNSIHGKNFFVCLALATSSCSESSFQGAAARKDSKKAENKENSNPTTEKEVIAQEEGETSLECKKTGKGKIIVSNDEWAFSEAGMAAAPDAAQYGKNVALWLGGCEGRASGKFHAYSSDFSLTAPTLAKIFSSAGHTWTTGVAIELTSESFAKYDWIFLAGRVPDATKLAPLLVEFVEKGGGLYISAGTYSNAATEASWWNPIITKFGIQFASTYNNIKGNIPIAETIHPIFKNVHLLYQNNGNSLSLVAPLSAKTKMYVSQGNHGLYAIFDGAAGD